MSEDKRDSSAYCPKAPLRSPWLSRTAALVALAAAAVLLYRYADGPAREHLQNIGWRLRRNAWVSALAELGKCWSAVWLVLLIAWRRRRSDLVAQAAVGLLLTGMLVVGVKFLVQRPRPGDTAEEIQAHLSEGRLPSYRFPSGDTASAFALAVAAASAFGSWRRAVPFGLAGAVGVLRALTYRHYPSDAAAGAMAGLLAGWAAMPLGACLHARLPARAGNRRDGLFWLAWGLPAALIAEELISSRYRFRLFLAAFGPLVAAALIWARGRAWWRWLAGRGFGRPASERKRAAHALFMTAVLAALSFLPALPWTTLWDRDEGYYVGCAQEMADRGDPFVPRFSGRPWLEKPPLTYWAMALSLRFVPGGEAAARLPSALAAIAAMLLTLRLGRRMYGLPTGALAAGILGTTLLFAGAGRMATLDTTLVGCVLLALNGLWDYLDGGRRGGLWVFYVGCGLGGLAKGPLGVALPFLALAGYAVWTRSWRRLPPLRLFPGALIILLILGAWMGPANWRTDGDLLYELVWIRTLRPVFVPLQGHGGANIGTYLATLPVYLPVVLLGFLPWSVFLLTRWRETGGAERWRGRREGFLLGWAAALFVVFSLVRTKLPHYVLPLFPPLSLLCAAALLRPPAPPDRARRERRILVGTALCVGVVAAVFPLAAGFPDAVPFFLPAGLAFAGSGWMAARALRRGRTDRAVIVLLAGMCLALGLAWQVGLPALERGKSSRRIAEHLRARYGPSLKDARVGALGYREVSVAWYLRKPLIPVGDLAAFLRSPETSVVILPESRLRAARESGAAAGAAVLWQERVWLAEKNKWQEVAVIANRPPPGRAPNPLRTPQSRQ